MLRIHGLKASLIVLTLSLCVGVPIVNAEVVPLNWTSPTTAHLMSVFLVGTSDGWAVGASGTIIRWTGIDWILEFPLAILTPVLIGFTLVAVTLAKTASKKRRKPSMPSKT